MKQRRGKYDMNDRAEMEREYNRWQEEREGSMKRPKKTKNPTSYKTVKNKFKTRFLTEEEKQWIEAVTNEKFEDLEQYLAFPKFPRENHDYSEQTMTDMNDGAVRQT